MASKKGIEVDPSVIEKKADMNYILEKVKEVDYELAELEELYNHEQDRIKCTYNDKKKKLEYSKSLLLGNLKALFDEVPQKETRTQKKVELLGGDVVVKKATVKIDYDKAKLLEWAKANNMHELISIKTVEDFKWSEYKTQLTITDNGIINNETGEIVNIEGLTVKEVPEEIQVKY